MRGWPRPPEYQTWEYDFWEVLDRVTADTGYEDGRVSQDVYEESRLANLEEKQLDIAVAEDDRYALVTQHREAYRNGEITIDEVAELAGASRRYAKRLLADVPDYIDCENCGRKIIRRGSSHRFCGHCAKRRRRDATRKWRVGA